MHWRERAWGTWPDGGWRPWATVRCIWYWTPYTRTAEVWTDHNSGQQFKLSSNLSPKPEMRCGGITSTEDIWETWKDPWRCSLPFCFMCEKETQPILRLRGLCPDSRLTNIFTPDNVGPKGQELAYIGLSDINIKYNTTSFLCTLDSYLQGLWKHRWA